MTPRPRDPRESLVTPAELAARMAEVLDPVAADAAEEAAQLEAAHTILSDVLYNTAKESS
ncbi:hypothetical protein [Corynebacterium uterequi]|uniref:hypothetical protein n=1 Tax=Corynebacterium uterequi TaxID=1072256 RepID=UPI001F188A1C|nr:hypothetical protein [Corynebacterium uterequi]